MRVLQIAMNDDSFGGAFGLVLLQGNIQKLNKLCKGGGTQGSLENERQSFFKIKKRNESELFESEQGKQVKNTQIITLFNRAFLYRKSFFSATQSMKGQSVMHRKKTGVFLVLNLSLLLIFFSTFWPSSCLAIENSECMECHGDDSLARESSEGMREDIYLDYNRFKLSVHNINGITCVDCHSDIEKLNDDDDVPHPVSLAAVRCEGCHDAEGAAYLNSVHKKASGKGITIPCYACHGYHFVSYLEANSVFERENGFCLKCHNPSNFHDWLPQKEAHFAFVECTVCHSPDAPRHIALRFYDLVRDKFISGAEFLDALNTDYAGFLPMIDKNKDGQINLDEFENMILLMRQKDVRGTFHGEVVVDLVPSVHHVNRGNANRECEQCHNPTSPFFREVYISLNKDDGNREHIKVERKVLESYYVNHFYALGGTRVRLLDKIGLAIAVGGVGVVFGHLTVRILTIPIRRRRKEKEKKHSA